MATTRMEARGKRHKETPVVAGVGSKSVNGAVTDDKNIAALARPQALNAIISDAPDSATGSGTSTSPRGRYEWLRFVLASALPPTTKNVYTFLWSRCGMKLETFWSYPAIATAVGITDREAKFAIRRLIQFGALTVTGRHPEGDVRYRPNVYRLEPLGVNTRSRLRGEQIDHPGVNVGSPNYKKQRKKQQQQAAPARRAAPASVGGCAETKSPDPDPDLEAKKAILKTAGVSKTMTAKLAAHPNATLELLTAGVAGGVEPGTAVNQIRDAIAKAETGQDILAKRQAGFDHLTEEHRQSERAVRCNRELEGRCRELLEALDEPTRAEWWGKYLDTCNGSRPNVERMGIRRFASETVKHNDRERWRDIHDRALVGVA